MNAIPLINNIPKTNINNEKQLRQEINTSLVALKKEAGTLEGLINEAAQMLVTINNRIATLENDTVKKSDIVDVVQSGNLQPVTSNAVANKISSLDVPSVGGSGKYISAISETDGKINATATDLATSVASENNAPVTSGAVNDAFAYVSKFIIPIRMTYYSVSLTSYALYKLLGTGFKAYYDALPNINGKTKKVRLVFNIYTQSDNTITISLQKRNDTNYTEIYSGTVWGGMAESAYSNLVSAVIDPAFLNSYTSIFFKTSNSSYSVGIGFCFAEVYYE